jgi:Photosynthetic reaction centre cytochrome C subunit
MHCKEGITMRVGRRRAWFGALFIVNVCVLGVVATARQAPQGPLMSENYFKNIQVLKGIPVDEFMDAMGMFSASLGYDCVSCHSSELYNDRNAFAIATPMIQRARQMIVMMNAINKQYFAGQPRMSCFTCHRGQDRPGNIPSLAIQYGELMDDPNAMTIYPDTRNTVEQVFTKYVTALGGAQRLAGLTSYVATGTYEGFNTGGSPIPVDVYAKAPNQRAQVVHMREGDAVKTFDGTQAWAAEGWRPMPLLQLTGGNLEGAKLEALVQFPGEIQKAYANWQVSGTLLDGKSTTILQGTNANALPVNFYFDADSGLLVRIVRWNRTAVGIVPTQIDFTDYRDVNGVKMPHHMVLTWTDGQNTYEFKQIRPNVAIEAARFNRPAPYTPRKQ